MRGREVRLFLGRFSSCISLSNKLDLQFGFLLLGWFPSMVAGIDELGEVQIGRSAVLVVVEEVPGSPSSLMLLGGGLAQEGTGLLVVVVRAWQLNTSYQAAAAPPAAGPPAAAPRAGGDVAGCHPRLGVHGGSEWEASLQFSPRARSQIQRTGCCCVALDTPSPADASSFLVFGGIPLQIHLQSSTVCGFCCSLANNWISI